MKMNNTNSICTPYWKLLGPDISLLLILLRAPFAALTVPFSPFIFTFTAEGPLVTLGGIDTFPPLCDGAAAGGGGGGADEEGKAGAGAEGAALLCCRFAKKIKKIIN